MAATKAEKFSHSHELARKLLPFLGKRNIPVTPENYMIFYLYFEGENPTVRRVVEEHLQADLPWSANTTKTIYQQLFSSEANLAMLNRNEQLAMKVQDVAQGIIEESDLTAELADRTSANLRNSLEEMRNLHEIREVAQWLQHTMDDVNLVTEVSRKLGSNLRENGAKLGEIVESLSRMENLAMTDDLTKIGNRRAWDHRLQAEFDRYTRYERPCSLLMLDLDDFKNINDKFGHLVGDQALMVVARILSSGLRSMDFPARYGGEEFAALLPETSLEGAKLVAEKLRRSLSHTRFTVHGDIVQITASFGVSAFNESDGDASECLGRADRAMYKAKEAGKNLVMDEELNPVEAD